MSNEELFVQLINLLGYNKEENYPQEDYKTLCANADSILKLLKSNKNLFDTFIKLGVSDAGVFERSKEFNASEIIDFMRLLNERDNNFNSITIDNDILTFEVWKSYISMGIQSKPAEVVENMMKLYSIISDIMSEYFHITVHFDSTIECFYYLQEAISFIAYCVASPEIRENRTVTFCNKILPQGVLSFSSHNLDTINLCLNQYKVRREQKTIWRWDINFLEAFKNLF